MEAAGLRLIRAESESIMSESEGLEALEALRIQFGQLGVDRRPCVWDVAF